MHKKSALGLSAKMENYANFKGPIHILSQYPTHTLYSPENRINRSIPKSDQRSKLTQKASYLQPGLSEEIMPQLTSDWPKT